MIKKFYIKLMASVAVIFAGQGNVHVLDQLIAMGEYVYLFDLRENFRENLEGQEGLVVQKSPIWQHIAFEIASKAHTHSLSRTKKYSRKDLKENRDPEKIIPQINGKAALFILPEDRIALIYKEGDDVFQVEVSYNDGGFEDPEACFTFRDYTDRIVRHHNRYIANFVPLDDIDQAIKTPDEIKQIGPDYRSYEAFVMQLNRMGIRIIVCVDCINVSGFFVGGSQGKKLYENITWLMNETIENFQAPALPGLKGSYFYLPNIDEILRILLDTDNRRILVPTILIVLETGQRLILSIDATYRPCILAPNPNKDGFEDKEEYFVPLSFNEQGIQQSKTMIDEFFVWATELYGEA